MIPDRYAPVTYALFRIIFGYVFLLFGLQKMFGWFGGQQAQLMSLQGAAGAVETIGGLLIMIGLFTRVAAFMSSGEMAVAYFYVHVMQLGAPPMGPGCRSDCWFRRRIAALTRCSSASRFSTSPPAALASGAPITRWARKG